MQRTAQSDSFLNSVPYSSIPNLFTTLDTTSLEVSGIIKTQASARFKSHWTGRTSGIARHWNQLYSSGFPKSGRNDQNPEDLGSDNRRKFPGSGTLSYGSVYTAAQIDQALTLEDPYSLVPSSDTDGHGTSLAGAAAEALPRQEEFSGAAPKAGILMVKLKPAKEYLRRFYFADSAAPIFRETDC